MEGFEADGSARDGGSAAPPVGRFGEYDLLGEVAEGGMGVVHRARQRSLGPIVALKMVRTGQLASAEEIRRFREEASTVAGLQHPGIVAVHEVGELDGQHFFAMEWVEGRSFDRVLSDGPLPPEEAARLLAEVAGFVEYAHGRGVLHRDLKPSNILIDAAGRPRLLDFGLARSVSSAGDPTLTGTVMDSPSYMSPEQALGRHKEVGVRSDVHALGDPLRGAHRPAAVPRGERGGDAAPGHGNRTGGAAGVESPASKGPGNPVPPLPREVPCPTLRLGGGTGRRTRPLPPR